MLVCNSFLQGSASRGACPMHPCRLPMLSDDCRSGAPVSQPEVHGCRPGRRAKTSLRTKLECLVKSARCLERFGREHAPRLRRLPSPLTEVLPTARVLHRAQLRERQERVEPENIPTHEAGKSLRVKQITGNTPEGRAFCPSQSVRLAGNADLGKREEPKNIPTTQAGISFVHSELPRNFGDIAGGPASGDVEERL